MIRALAKFGAVWVALNLALAVWIARAPLTQAATAVQALAVQSAAYLEWKLHQGEL